MCIDMSMFLKSAIIIKTSDEFWQVSVGPVRKFKSIPDSAQRYFFISDFFLQDKNPWWQYSKNYRLSHDELSSFIENNLNRLDGDTCTINWVEPSLDEFCERLQSIKEKFSKTKIKKVVPVICEESQQRVSSYMKLKWVKRLLELPSHLTPYAFWEGERGMLGATPELLFNAKDNKITTMALAGTSIIPNKLLKDSKELEEHRFVVDYLKSELSKLGEYWASETREWDVGHLYHLRTNLGVRLKSWSFTDCYNLIKSLHPTPALGVYPKENKSWLKDQKEAQWRKGFGAPIGIWDKEESCFFVAIRCVMWDEKKIRLASGCGVIESSVALKEWDELKAKRESVKVQLGL